MARLRFMSLKQYNVTQCNKKARLALFEAVGLKMHFIGFQTNYFYADTS